MGSISVLPPRRPPRSRPRSRLFDPVTRSVCLSWNVQNRINRSVLQLPRHIEPINQCTENRNNPDEKPLAVQNSFFRGRAFRHQRIQAASALGCRSSRIEKRKSASTVIESQTGNLKPWREVLSPHQDVASGRYQQAEFA